MYNPNNFTPINYQSLKEEEIKKLNDEKARELYHSLIDELSKFNTELADEWEEKLDEEDISYQEACIKLKEVVTNRSNIERYGSLDEEDEITIITRDGRKITFEEVESASKYPENFLGNGSVANVYSLPKHKEKICVKIVTNPEMYDEGNSIHQEAKFLTRLKDFKVAGVRTPWLYYAHNNLGTVYMVQEELDAVNFRRVLEGHDELPENFDLEDYFKRLKVYLNAIHEKGIYHQDFVLRNMMINRKTGLPIVIDFGKSVHKNDIMGEKFDTLSEIKIKKDLAGLESSLAEARQKIINNRLISK